MTYETKAENAAFTANDLTFDGVTFQPRTIGALMYASVELAMDAPNFGQAIEMALVKGLAAEVDRQVLAGSGGSEMMGLINNAGVNAITSVGAAAWEHIANAVALCQVDNHQPNAYVLHPTIAYDLSVLASGDAANAAKLWLGEPPTVQPLQQFITTNITTANAIVGDFSMLALGVRRQPTVQISEVAGSAFQNAQVAIRILYRADVCALYDEAFCVLSGVTT